MPSPTTSAPSLDSLCETMATGTDPSQLVTVVAAAVTAAATIVIAAFAWLTWRVYAKLRDLAAVNNEILEETNRISAAMVEETRLVREAQHEPQVFLNPGGYSDVKGVGPRLQWNVKNFGPGKAFNLRLESPQAEGTLFMATLLPGDEFVSMGNIRLLEAREPGAYFPSASLTYCDRFGNSFRTVYQHNHNMWHRHSQGS